MPHHRRRRRGFRDRRGRSRLRGRCPGARPRTKGSNQPSSHTRQDNNPRLIPGINHRRGKHGSEDMSRAAWRNLQPRLVAEPARSQVAATNPPMADPMGDSFDYFREFRPSILLRLSRTSGPHDGLPGPTSGLRSPRTALHSHGMAHAGTYWISDGGRGGAGNGEQRFAPSTVGRQREPRQGSATLWAGHRSTARSRADLHLVTNDGRDFGFGRWP